MANYFISDLHFIDMEASAGYQNASILTWERTQFKDKYEHNNFLLDKFEQWAHKLKDGDNFYVLGDWGDPFYLSSAMFPFTRKDIHTVFVAGNHDKIKDREKFEIWFDEVHWYPFNLNERLIISHFPQAIWPGQVNVCGHLHGMKLNNPGYICCSINDTDYNLISDKHINGAFSKIPKMDTHFLEEPWADMYQVTKRDTEDLIVRADNTVDISATKAYRKMLEKFDK